MAQQDLFGLSRRGGFSADPAGRDFPSADRDSYALDSAAGGDLFIFAEGDGRAYVLGAKSGGWIDRIKLENAVGGAPASDWTLVLSSGSVVDDLPDHKVLSDDAAGTIVLADGSRIEFVGIEVIQW